MDKVSIEELVLAERKFLHDLSNKLLIAQGMSTFVSRRLAKNEGVEEKDLERCEKLMKSIKDMTSLLVSRREVLHQLSEDFD
jgi:hypothetical protein